MLFKIRKFFRTTPFSVLAALAVLLAWAILGIATAPLSIIIVGGSFIITVAAFVRIVFWLLN